MNGSAPDGGLRKVKRAQYVQITNETVRDTRISYRALGILTELLSHEEGWVVRTKDLGRRRKEGADAIGAALRELAAAGYYRVERRRGPSGTFSMGTAVADYPIQAWAEDFQRHPRGGVPVRVDENGNVLDDPTPEPIVSDLAGSGFSGSGEPGPGYAGPGNPDPLEDQSPNTITEGSAARSAATANPVETSSSNDTFRNARDSEGAAAAQESADDEHGDATRADNTPASILDAMLLNTDEAARFRAWLVTATNATNPDGLVVSLHTSGRLSERIAQWRTSETSPGAATGHSVALAARPGRLEWCGRCDRDTRTAAALDHNGREYIRRCPTCNINAGQTVPGSGASQAIAQQVQLAAANTTGSGRDAYRAARAALPQGTGRRITTIGDPVDPKTMRQAGDAQ
jgi:hypothetical protein